MAEVGEEFSPIVTGGRSRDTIRTDPTIIEGVSKCHRVLLNNGDAFHYLVKQSIMQTLQNFSLFSLPCLGFAVRGMGPVRVICT